MCRRMTVHWGLLASPGQPRAGSFCAEFKCGIKPVFSSRGND